MPYSPLDDELEGLEETGQTDAEQVDESSEIEDAESDLDEIMGEESQEDDLEHAYDSFSTNDEADYDGWSPDEVTEQADLHHSAEVLGSQPDAFHLEDDHDLEEQVIEMEIEDGDIYAVIVDEDDNEIGFVLLDENGNEQEYYYVDDPDGETIDAEGDEPAHAVRASDGEEFDLGVTREGVTQATADLNAIYKDGAEVVSELKDTFSDITESLNFLKKPKVSAAHPKNPMTGV